MDKDQVICKPCPLKNQRFYPYFLSPTPPEFAIILDSPADFERIVPYLQLIYKELSIPNADIYFALCCVPPRDAKKSFLKQYRKICGEYFRRYFPLRQYRYIIALGELALIQFFNKNVSFSNYRGRVIPLEDGRLLFSTYSLQFLALHGFERSTYYPLFIKDLKFFRDYLQGTLKTRTEEYIHLTQSSTVNFESKVLALDAEWDEEGNLLLFSITDGKNVYYVKPDDLTPYLKKALYNAFRNKYIVVANRPADERVLSKYLTFPETAKFLDLFNIARLVDDNLQINLENIVAKYADERFIKDIVRKREITQLSEEELIHYNATDTRTTFIAFTNLLRELKQDPKLYHYYKYFTIPVENALAQVGMRPFKIDEQKLEENSKKVLEEMTRLELELLSEVPFKLYKKYFSSGEKPSLSKPDFVRDILYSKHGLGLKVLEKTATGKPSLSQDVLKQYDHPFVQKYLKWKFLFKLHNTFFEGLRRNLKNGYLYINQVLWGTATGRTSSFSPNLQQTPRDGYMVELYKELFSAPEGWLMGTRDLSQSEIRIMGWLANDKNILRALREGIDIHKYTASLILKKPMDEITKEERQLAKAINFGFLYGAGAKLFKEYAKKEYNVDVSLEEAEEFRKRFFEIYPAIPSFHTKCIITVEQQGYIRNVLGRVRKLPHVYSTDPQKRLEAHRQAINFPIQSFSAELTLIAYYLFYEETKNDPNVQLLWQIHDSIFFIAKEETFPYYMHLLKECMEKKAPEYIKKHWGITIGYPVESEGKWGKNWATLEDYPENQPNIEMEGSHAG